MKRLSLLYMLLLCMLSAGVSAFAQRQDANVLAIKLKELNLRKSNLQRQIQLEDQKRNQQLPGVSPETLEQINDRQDSLCLALRSQLVSVELEIKELTPDEMTATLLNQLNALNQQAQ